MIRSLIPVALVSILASCSVSQDQEVALGRQNAEEINAQLPIVTDPAVSEYIQTLGDSIARTTSRADLEWHFYVVNTKQVNAFALPGGYIYVNRGLIESARKLDELTGTLGHEIGHVIQRHTVKQMQTAEKANAGVAVVCTLTSICHSGLAQVAVQVGGTALFAKHSRLDELQADSEGVVNVTRAGYDPQGIPDLFQVLLKERQYQPTAVEGWFASHPLEETRITRANELIAQMKLDASRPLVVDNPEFHAFKTRVSALPPPPPARRLPSGQP
ncbi:MAG TPA: M48 family metallopeptidase [Gemmatimonadaceae bacterium]|jgi:predicted Zn-dependent protease|nr:M48 family metallopeptidase [Gemmatimonadaceae bacterium]